MGEIVLEARRLTIGYRGVPAVEDLDLVVRAGEVVALLGANGAGKTTSLLGMAGALPALSGSVTFLGTDQSAGLAANARRGMALLTDDRAIFRELSVWDNLRLGRGTPETALAQFPQLEPLRHRKAGLLSGGEQQMLGLARILAADPRLLLADELSLGLAPVVVTPLFAALRRLADEKSAAVLLVEQHVRAALAIADRVIILERGRVAFQGTADELARDESILARSYFSTGSTTDTEGVTGDAVGHG